MSSKLDRLKRILKRNERYRQYRSVVKRIKNLADFDNLTKEMEQLHKIKKTRDASTKKVGPDRLIDMHAQSMSFRSRMVEIRVLVSKAKRAMDKELKDFSQYLLIEYGEYLSSNTMTGKRAEIEIFLSSGYEVQEDMAQVIEIADLLIADLDQSGWTLKHMLESLVLIHNRESIISKRSV